MKRAGIIPYVVANGRVEMAFMVPSDAAYGGIDPQIAKGRVDLGDETPCHAAIREGAEELGLLEQSCIAPPFFLCCERIIGQYETYHLDVFAVEVESKHSFTDPGRETATVVWLSPQEFRKVGRPSHVPFVNALALRLYEPKGCSHLIEFQHISEFYSNRTADRSKVPLINHIIEGLDILRQCGASDDAMRAFCLHPIVQDDGALRLNNASNWINNSSPRAILLAMEYRRAANAYLCRPSTDHWTIEEMKANIGLLLPEVRDMLIADKIQNRKDFILHHKGTHPRSEQLDQYFLNWLNILEVNGPFELWIDPLFT